MSDHSGAEFLRIEMHVPPTTPVCLRQTRRQLRTQITHISHYYYYYYYCWHLSATSLDELLDVVRAVYRKQERTW